LRREDNQLDVTECFIALNMFRALLCPSSGARVYMCVVTAYGVKCLVTGCRRSVAEQQTVSLGRCMLHDMLSI